MWVLPKMSVDTGFLVNNGTEHDKYFLNCFE